MTRKIDSGKLNCKKHSCSRHIRQHSSNNSNENAARKVRAALFQTTASVPCRINSRIEQQKAFNWSKSPSGSDREAVESDQCKCSSVSGRINSRIEQQQQQQTLNLSKSPSSSDCGVVESDQCKCSSVSCRINSRIEQQQQQQTLNWSKSPSSSDCGVVVNDQCKCSSVSCRINSRIEQQQQQKAFNWSKSPSSGDCGAVVNDQCKCSCGITTCHEDNWTKPVFGLWELAEESDDDSDVVDKPTKIDQHQQKLADPSKLMPLYRQKYVISSMQRQDSRYHVKRVQDFINRLSVNTPRSDDEGEDHHGIVEIDQHQGTRRQACALPGDYANISYSDVTCFRKPILSDDESDVSNEVKSQYRRKTVSLNDEDQQPEEKSHQSNIRDCRLSKLAAITTEVIRICGELYFCCQGSSMSITTYDT